MTECQHPHLNIACNINSNKTDVEPIQVTTHAAIRLYCQECQHSFCFDPEDASISFDGTVMTIRIRPQAVKKGFKVGGVGITPRQLDKTDKDKLHPIDEVPAAPPYDR